MTLNSEQMQCKVTPHPPQSSPNIWKNINPICYNNLHDPRSESVVMKISEKAVLSLFSAGGAIGLGSILSGLIKNNSAVELTPYITTAFLMSISGNCTRILANDRAGRFEKIIISAAVLSYATALSSDCDNSTALAIYLKLITTGCVGAWNAAQMVRLNAVCFTDSCRKITSLQSPFPIESTDDQVAIAAFSCYALGAALGYGAISIGLSVGSSLNKLAPFITFAFLMSHCGNMVRSEFNDLAPLREKCLIRAAVSCYFIALCCDFSGEPKTNPAAAYTKLAAAGLVGIWNADQTWRINKTTARVIPTEDTHILVTKECYDVDQPSTHHI